MLTIYTNLGKIFKTSFILHICIFAIYIFAICIYTICIFAICKYAYTLQLIILIMANYILAQYLFELPTCFELLQHKFIHNFLSNYKIYVFLNRIVCREDRLIITDRQRPFRKNLQEYVTSLSMFMYVVRT